MGKANGRVIIILVTILLLTPIASGCAKNPPVVLEESFWLEPQPAVSLMVNRPITGISALCEGSAPIGSAFLCLPHLTPTITVCFYN